MSYPYPLNQVQAQQPRMDADYGSNVSCELCGNPADFICACKVPLQGFCSGHLQAHRAKFPQADHYQVPAIHLGKIPTDHSELTGFRSKQKLIDHTLDKLQLTKRGLQMKKADTERIFDDLLRQLNTVREETMESISEQITAIETKINEFETGTEQLRFNPNYAPRSQLEYLVACENTAELERKNWEMLKVDYPGASEAKRAIDQLVKVNVNLRLFDQAPVIVPEEAKEAVADADAIFPYVTSMRLVLFRLPRCDTYSKRDFPPRHRPRLDDCSQIVALPDRKVFCVGGRESNYAYTIVANSGFVTEEPRMSQKRGCPGVVLVMPYVFVFGGTYRETDLKHCERFLLPSKVWVPIQGVMNRERSGFTPCAYSRKIFLLGGGPDKGEYYSEEYDACYNLPFNMPSHGPAITFVTNNNWLVVISGNEMYRLVDNRLDKLNKRCGFEANSHIVPVKIGGFLYFSDWTTDLKVIRMDLTSLRWDELAKYPQGSL